MNPQLDFRNTNALWGSVLVETLVRCGLKHAIISPGSRSTPLTMAFARHPGVESIPVLDERSASFLALGLAKRTRLPVALVCTSGTAGANYFPAVIEASESDVPVLVFTADRPPEMRDCSSGQTIDQHRLYGNYPVWQHELAVPGTSIELLRYLRQTIRHAWTRARSGGPVHLNCPFRDPLPPIEDGSAKDLVIEEDFFAAAPTAESPRTVWTIPDAWRAKSKGILVVGPAVAREPADFAAKGAALSRTLGWPVLADALSPMRHHAGPGELVCGFESFLRSDYVAKKLAPYAVVSIGGWPISKTLREWIGGLGAPTWIVTPSSRNLDAMHTNATHLVASIEDLEVDGSSSVGHWIESWQTAEKAAQSSYERSLGTGDDIVEPRLSRLLPEMLADGTSVFVASSMPVRDMEYFWPAGGRKHRIHFNRGANGIDGTLSTAVGLAHGGGPAVLVTGDLAFLHDSNGLLHAANFRGSLTVLLINNNGGGIFEHLPVAKFDPPFEKFWATPQNVDFAKLCAANGVAHAAVEDWSQLRDLLAAQPLGIRILEIKTDRKRDTALRKSTFASAADAAAQSLG